MSVKTFSRSFAGGVITPEMFGRLDLVKNQTGLDTALNWEVLPHGPVQNRAGFGYVLEAKDSTQPVKVIPFSYNTEQTFILEFGHQYVRFHTQGATLLETGLTVTGVSKANPGVLSYTGTDPANGDWMYLSGLGGMTQLNGRYVKVANVNTGANTFEITNIHGGANINTTSYTTYTSGGTAARVYTLATPYDADDLFDLHYVQSADVLTLVHPSYPVKELRRLSATEWELTTVSFSPQLSAPAVDGATPSPITHSYKVSTNVLSYDVEGGTIIETLPSTAVTASNDLTVAGSYNTLTWTAVNQAVSYVVYKESSGVYYFLGTSGGPSFVDDSSKAVDTSRQPGGTTSSLVTGLVATATTSGGAINATATVGSGTVTYSYKVTSVSEDGTVESFPTNPAACTNNLSGSGHYNTISWAAVAGVTRYNVYKESNGLYGYIGQAEGTTFKDDNITPDISLSPPQSNTPFETTDNYPGAVGYHDQRRCFAGTNNRPQNFWATRSGTESNLTYSIPSRDDDAISFRTNAHEVNRIRHLVSLDQLIMLTSGGEWKVAPQNADVLTPSSAWPKQMSAEGASNVQPVVAAGSVLYVQESGSRLRELKYSWEANGYDVRDASIMATHLFDDHTLTDLAYSKAPHKMVWATRSDGGLLGLTYLPEQQVMAWHEHDTQGSFESVACVKEGSEHVLYAVVKRTINGREVRNIERKRPRRFTSRADAFFVDAGLTYDGAASSTITGLWHLEGAEVACLADGAEVTGLTVTNGSVTLPAEASVVHVGLGVVADLKLLPPSLEMQAYGQGIAKNLNSVALRLKDTSGLLVGASFTEAEMQDITTRNGENYDTPPDLITGLTEPIDILPEWGQDPQLCIRQRTPLPAMILSVTQDVAFGG